MSNEPATPYAKLDEDRPESSVSINIIPTKGTIQNDYTCAVNSYACGLSLRTGCIVVTTLYLIYAIALLAISLGTMNFSDPYDYGPRYFVAHFFSPYTDLFCAIIALFIIVLLIIGIVRKSPYYLHIAKWLMIIDCGLAVFEAIQIAIWRVEGLLFIHLLLQIVPIHFILVVNSYEGQLLYDFRQKKIQAIRAKETVNREVHH